MLVKKWMNVFTKLETDKTMNKCNLFFVVVVFLPFVLLLPGIFTAQWSSKCDISVTLDPPPKKNNSKNLMLIDIFCIYIY